MPCRSISKSQLIWRDAYHGTILSVEIQHLVRKDALEVLDHIRDPERRPKLRSGEVAERMEMRVVDAIAYDKRCGLAGSIGGSKSVGAETLRRAVRQL